MSRTIELNDELIESIESLAAREATTPGAIVERAVRELLGRAVLAKAARAWESAAVGGDGPSPEFADAEWESVRNAIYSQPM